MVSQSKFQQEDRQDSRRRPHADPFSGLPHIIKQLYMNHNDLASYLEPFLRRIVREEVERKIQQHLFPRATVNEGGTSGAKPLELRFINKLADTIFTHSNIIAVDKETPLQIALYDVRSQSVVRNGPLSCIKVEICALDGEFRSEDWSVEEFHANILRQREDRGALLNGDRFISLQDGLGCITNMKFTDNSSWIRSQKFRLGVRVAQSFSCGVSIKEGKTEPFRVKDYRGESYKKHHPPSLDDDIWRLEKIAKDGTTHKRLSLHGIKTVKDLLQLYIISPSSLQEKVGNIPNKSWLAITEHAKACVIDDYNLYMYHAAEQSIGLLFNSICMLVGVTFDGQNYCSPDTLTPNEKHMVEVVKQHAYRNLNTLKSVDGTSFNFQRPLTCLQSGQDGPLDHGLQQLNFPSVQPGQVETWAASDLPFTSTSYVDEGINNNNNNQFCVNPLPDLTNMSQYGSVEGEFFSGMHIEGNSWPHSGSHWTQNENPDIQFTNWGQENGLYFGSHGGTEFRSHSDVGVSNSGKPKAVWYKIRTALKWVISVRRDAAAKRMAKLIYYNY
ncbi:calmodulin-binding protein 60 D-like [Senna tora]|uniref:Calmodulin-binding protein 60 D-like n=1 Tax=Senna tora TaxID=362788 RepID=A0A834TA52_9FABA|nr:calmodulin-binding protein 60 D-like [Senna tora]